VEGSGGPTGDMTMRVPADQFETLLSRTRGLGRSLAVSSSGQDVTAAYVDLDARIHALEGTRAQFVQILSKASAIGDILAVEQQLSTLQTQLEQLQGQQKLLADQASLATLSVHLTEPGSTLAVPPSPPVRGPAGAGGAPALARRPAPARLAGLEAVQAARRARAALISPWPKRPSMRCTTVPLASARNNSGSDCR
jgi:hypothetical protein